jgi:hypothetical protein
MESSFLLVGTLCQPEQVALVLPYYRLASERLNAQRSPH